MKSGFFCFEKFFKVALLLWGSLFPFYFSNYRLGVFFTDLLALTGTIYNLHQFLFS